MARVGVLVRPGVHGRHAVTYGKLKAAKPQRTFGDGGIAAGAWFESSPGSLLQAPGRVVRGLAGSVMSLVPPGGDSSPTRTPPGQGRGAGTLDRGAGAWTCTVLAAPFDATLPYALGRRLSRAAGGSTALACAAACWCDAEVRGRSDASTFVKLRRGLRAVGVLHLLCFAAKVAFDDVQYRGVGQVLSVASLATYCAAAPLIGTYSYRSGESGISVARRCSASMLRRRWRRAPT